MSILTERERKFLRDNKSISKNIRWNVKKQIKEKFESLTEEECSLAFELLNDEDIKKIFNSVIGTMDIEDINKIIKEKLRERKEAKKLRRIFNKLTTKANIVLKTKISRDKQRINNSKNLKTILKEIKEKEPIKIKDLLRKYKYPILKEIYDRGIMLPIKTPLKKWRRAVLSQDKIEKNRKLKDFPFNLKKKDKEIEVILNKIYDKCIMQ